MSDLLLLLKKYLEFFKKNIAEYEEEIYRQRKLLAVVWKPEIKLHRIDLQQQHVCEEEEEEVLTDQQLCNQERSSSLDQEDPEPVQIKEEQKELCTSQEGEELQLKVDAATCMVTPTDEEKDHVKPEPESDHQLLLKNFYSAESQDQKGYKHEDSTRDVESEQNNRQYENKSHSNIVCNPNLSGANSNIRKLPFKCNTCGKDHAYMSYLLRHMRVHSVEKPYLCSICGKTFNRNRKLKRHERRHTDLQQQHVCEKEEEEVLTDQQLCNQERSSSLDQEDPEPVQIKEEQEELCTSQEGEEVQLKVEVNTFVVTPTDEERDHDDPEPESDHQLLLNNFYAAESQDQKEYEHGDSTSDVQSEQNNQQYENKSHSNIVCNPNLSGADSNIRKPPFKCNTCGKDFKQKSDLLRHVGVHSVEKLYLCSICGKTFIRNDKLKRHERIHTDEKPYSCKTCGKAFKERDYLAIHRRIHTAKDPYICNTCGKRFIHLTSFRVHKIIHTGEKPYLCKTCGKSFSLSFKLKVHERTHTGEKPYTCKTCEKSFARGNCLKLHIKRAHTNERPYLCKICGKGLVCLSDLRSHQKSHAGVLPHGCNMCEKRFKCLTQLKRHTATHT